jgi:hypothetical protein
MLALLSELCSRIPNEDLPLMAQISAQKEYLGYIDMTDTSRPNTAVVMDIWSKIAIFIRYTMRVSLTR